MRRRLLGILAALSMAGCAGRGPLGGPAWADSLVIVLCVSTLVGGLIFYSRTWGSVD